MWNGRIYQFQVLCFGVKNAPFVFNRLGQSIQEYLSLRGIRMIIYIDDILVLATSFHQCLQHAQFVIDTLIKLGFHIKIEKCVFTPSQEFYFLGYLWNSRTLHCSLPEEKLQNIKTLCQEALTSPKVSVKLLQRLLGTTLSARPAVPLARARSRGIQQMVLKFYNGTVVSAKRHVSLTKWAMEDIQWWWNLSIKTCSQSLRSIPVWETVRLASDAMDTAVGAVLEGRIMYRELDPIRASWRIAHKEWLAFEWMIRDNLEDLRNRVVSWHVDNTNVMHAWLNSGSIGDPWLCKEVINLQIILHAQNTLVVPRYIRSVQHLHADLISRNKVLLDWHLSRVVANKLFDMLGHPQIDLMATSRSHQVSHYYSALVDKGAAGVDAFTKDWNQFTLAYIFPPPVMMELVLNRIYQNSQNTKFLVISPWKPRAQWFPKALALSHQMPIRLPVSWNTVEDLAKSSCMPRTPSGAKIKFVAWQLTGKGGQRLEDCPLGLNKLFSRAGRQQLRQATAWDSDITLNIAEGISWTKLNRVQ